MSFDMDNFMLHDVNNPLGGPFYELDLDILLICGSMRIEEQTS